MAAEGADIAETAGKGNSGYGHIRAEQKVCGGMQPVIENILLGRDGKLLHEQTIQIGAVDADEVGDILYIDVLSVILSDVFDGFAQVGVFPAFVTFAPAA